MQLNTVECDDRGVRASFNDGTMAFYPHIWLRDNDPSGFHPKTRERTFDLTTVSLDIRPVEFGYSVSELSLRWPQQSERSCFDADWLYRHRPGVRRHDAASVDVETWTNQTLTKPPRFSAMKCASEPAYLVSMLSALKRYGIVVVDHLEDDPLSGEQFGDLIGFKRQTNYGVMFEVINKPDPNNLAYTALALPLHTDLANQEFVPGVQFLHCLANTAEGGDSVFADGFQVCRDMAEEEPALFDILRTTAIPWRFFDQSCDIISRWPVIQQYDDGQFKALTFNAHLADIPDLNPDRLIEFYRAYQHIMQRIRSPRYRLEYRLQAGEMVIMSNRRVLHGRTEFDPNSGYRHLRGYYIEMNEIDSRLRVLARAPSSDPLPPNC